MGYFVKECFNTIQGEALRAGTRAAFLRFAGCDLWTGREEDRTKGKGSCSTFCDTQFFGGTKYDLAKVMHLVEFEWPARSGEERWVVLTGGEPSLQVDQALVDALHSNEWKIAVETNGCTDNAAIRACDHICLSPKRARKGGQTDWQKLGKAHEIKVVLPGAAPGEQGWSDEELVVVERWAQHEAYEALLPVKGLDVEPAPVALFVQPQDPIAHVGGLTKSITRDRVLQENTQRCIDFVMAHPRWRLSVQSHKIVGLR